MSDDKKILWKDARILWNCDKSGKIAELIVAKFDQGIDCSEWPHHLHEIFTYDMGNAVLGWNHYDKEYILLVLFFDYGFADKEVAWKALRELCKIPEFEKSLNKFMSRGFMPYSGLCEDGYVIRLAQ